MEHGTVSKATLVKLLSGGVERLLVYGRIIIIIMYIYHAPHQRPEHSHDTY